MFQLVRSIRQQELVLRQIPAVGLAFVLAGSFYRFHSFYLETGAFLLTWFAIDAVFEGLRWSASRVVSSRQR